MINRRINIRAAGAVLCAGAAASGLLTACGSSTSATSSGGTSASTLKVGIITIGSGPYAAISKQSIDAAEVTAKELNAAQHKYKVEVEKIDTDGSVPETLQAVQKAIQSDGVRFVSGFLTSDTAPAIGAQAKRLGILELTSVAQDASLVGANCNSNYFQFDAVDSQYALANAQVLKTAGATSFDAIAEDYSLGHNEVDTLKSQLGSLGGGVKTAVFPALGSSDDGTQISQLGKSGAQGLYIALRGADAATFAKQATQFKLLPKYKFVMSDGFLEQPELPAMGNGVAGVHEVLNYSPDGVSKTPFAKDYAKVDPTGLWNIQISGNLALTMLDAAADKAASTDPAKIGSALSGLSMNTIVGQVTMRPQDHLLLQPLYPSEAVAGSNGPTLKVQSKIDTKLVTPPVSSACHMS